MPAVRRAEARDLDGVVALWSALMHHHAGFDSHYRVAQRAEEPWRKFLAGHLSRRDAAVFVCCEGGGPDGFSMVHLSRGPPVLPDRLRAEITDLFVRPELRRRGSGRDLVEAATQWARSRGVARLEIRVHARNREGQAFWRALGFADFVDVLERRL